MTTPDTAAVRAWAKDNGMTVADRGRLPAELHAAYLAANGGPAKPGSKADAKPVRATKQAAATKKPAPARKAAGTTVAVDEPAEVALTTPADEPARKTGGRAPAKAKAKAGAAKPRANAKKAPAKTTRATTSSSRTAAAAEPARDEDDLDLVEQEMADHVTPLAEADAPAPTASPDSSPDLARLIALEVQLSALAGRVAALEQSHAAPPPKQSRFRRRG